MTFARIVLNSKANYTYKNTSQTASISSAQPVNSVSVVNYSQPKFNLTSKPNLSPLYNPVPKYSPTPKYTNQYCQYNVTKSKSTLPEKKSQSYYSKPALYNNPVRITGNIGSDIVSSAKQYLGFNENDNSYKLFTQGRSEAWCADFVSYTVKEAYRKNGKKVPPGFGSSSVSGLRQWGINNNCYFSLDSKTGKNTAIAQYIKPGDVVIFKNGVSHTGIVTKVNSDGSFQTIEGNTSDKVAYRNYSANDRKISGFVQLA